MPAYISSIEVRPMPNLENLKKQAKLYLRWHRDRHYPAAARIRAVLPRFSQLSDREVLQHSFKLSDAQELVARKEGFDNWAALRKGVQTVTDTEALSKTSLLAAEPQLFVTDIAASCGFYTGKLGFSVAFTYGDPPFYGQVFRGGARLNLRCLPQPPIDPPASGQRTAPFRFHNPRRCDAALPRISSCRRGVPSNIKNRTMGCAHVHRPRS
jgi:Glyoxalase/Bleomycin resistance protein/Dioxygenase superfamily